jgi:hypothetical protein
MACRHHAAMADGRPSLDTSEIIQVFTHWSIEVPTCFSTAFVAPEGYWHGWAADRSISLTSLTVDDGGRPIPIDLLLATMPEVPGTPVDRMPPDLQGRAAYGPVEQPAPASSALCGLIAAEGRILIATITSDDYAWARATWLSIRHHPSRAVRRGGDLGAANTRNRLVHLT